MNNSFIIKDIDVIILCGGKGKRLKPLVNDRPKPMAEIGGCPFLDILIDYIASFGFRRFILCTGYKGDFIEKYYQTKDSPLTILFSQEKFPLGTAGAIKNAETLIESKPFFLAMNGDSLYKLDFKAFIDFYINKHALYSLVVSDIKDKGDYGKVVLDKNGNILSFYEKVGAKSKAGLVSVGIYLLHRAIFSEIPPNKTCSIEYDIFPQLVNKNFFGFVTHNKFIDIGTPERLKQVRKTHTQDIFK